MKRALILILLVSLAGLIWFSHRLAGVRIYHADECQTVSMARIIATGQTKAFYADAGLFQTGLGWLTRGATQSVDMFVAARFVMLEVFWLNVVLLALATEERLLSRRGLIALVGAATLAPLWDFGFEIRPDNLLLCGVLLMWCVARVRPTGLQPFFITGALAAGLPFIAFKAVAFTLPFRRRFWLSPRRVNARPDGNWPLPGPPARSACLPFYAWPMEPPGCGTCMWQM